MKILHVIPHAHPSGIRRELDSLLTAPSTNLQEVGVCCLGADTGVSQRWRAAGVDVLTLNWRRSLDLQAWWTLAKCIRHQRPAVIHAWGLTALRAVRLAAPKTKAAVVVRKPFSSPSSCSHRTWGSGQLLSPLDRWLLRGADRILAASAAEAMACAQAGLLPSKVVVVPPGVKPFTEARAEDKSLILCAGALLPHKGFYEAIWAFDILHFAHDKTDLVIAGEGPERRRLEDFAARTGLRQSIHLPGEVADLAPWLAKASIVWVPSLTDSGMDMTLEAMAAGRPVIASRWPGLAELVVDGETGLLFEPGSKMDQALQTHRALNDPALCRRLGDAGQRRAQELYSPEAFVQAWTAALPL